MGQTTLRVLGLLLMLLSLMMIPPIFVEAFYQDGYALIYHLSFVATFGLGFLLWFFFRHACQPLRTHDGFFLVVLFWLVASLVGMLPFALSLYPKLSFTNAFFEAVSGITSTGATILTQIDGLPHSFIFYRQQLQFLGGIGVIILAVAILPTLGIGGMQLYRNEISGPVKDNKLTPRIAHTAKAIWMIYVALALLCIILYWLAGMSFFDAICFSFSTVATGGFAPHNSSIGYFESTNIRIIAIVFMLLGAMSFNLHFIAFRSHSLKAYKEDPELRHYLKILFLAVIITWIALVGFSQQKQEPLLWLNAFFEVISFATTTGLSATDISFWPIFILLGLCFLGLMGGCAGSTSGGLKVLRVLLLQMQGKREVFKLIHPHGQVVVKLGNKPISPRLMEAIWGFFSIYFVVFTLLFLLLLISEHDFLTLYSALICTLSNTGRGLGNVINNYDYLSNYVKWILSFAMIAGRLEIFVILVLLSPTFWRR